MQMESSDILLQLEELGMRLGDAGPVEMVLIGGAAGMLTGQLSKTRVTTDCDVIRWVPDQSQHAVLSVAKEMAREKGLPEDWINAQAMVLDILPDGWHVRKVHIDTFGSLCVSCISRQDLLATKFYAGHPRDVEDISSMSPSADELAFVRTYLNMLRVPSRQANLDQVSSGMQLLAAFKELGDE
jgi:hypothetical protein